MADIATVLKKTIDGLPTNNPDIRQRVYVKARASILGRLEAKEPRLEQATIDKQMAGIDRIIAAVESEYAFQDQVDDVLGDSLEAPAPVAAPAPAPVPPAPAAPVVQPAAPPPAARPAVDPASPASQPAGQTPARAAAAPVAAAGMEGPASVAPRGQAPRKARGSAFKAIAWVVLVVLVLGGGGYAAWVNQDALREQFSRLTAFVSGMSGPDAQLAMNKDEGGEPAADAASDAQTRAKQPADAQDSEKFTQRLLADGSEVDPGAATGEPSVGEGTSVASASQPSDTPPSREPDAAADGETGADQATDSKDTAVADKPQTTVPVGQRAIFYEEQTSSAQETADQGNVVWEKVEESPGEDAPREPAIRADVSIPGKNLTLRMTIRRNIDKTLPASHIIELVFVTPEGFPGGAVDDVLRVAFKDSEQAAGNPLIGLPVKIDDGLFLYALTDGAAEVETNTMLMRRQPWIDVTILYRTGRRALITMEKGIPGSAVFDDVLKAWASAVSTDG